MTQTFSLETPELLNHQQKAMHEKEPNLHKSISPKQSKNPRIRPLDSLSQEILKLVRDARYVSGDDIAALIPSERLKLNSLQVKLNTLVRGEFLARPAAQKYLEHDRGRPTLVYSLGRNGARLLGVPYQESNRRFRFLEHALMTSKIYLTFLNAAINERADIELWEREPDDMPCLYIPEMRKTFPNGFVNRPDGLIEYTTDRQNRLYLECETGEVAPARSNFRQSSVLRQALYYRELYKLTQKQFPAFRVLFFIKDQDPRYFDDCRKVCRDIDPHRVGLNIFWFSFFDNVRVANPQVMLHEPFWFTPSATDGQALL